MKHLARKSKFEFLYQSARTCHRCKRDLETPASIKRGYGRHCWELVTRSYFSQPSFSSEKYAEVIE